MATATAAPVLTKRQRYQSLIQQLESERNTWLPTWRELSDYVLQHRGRFLVEETNRGDTGSPTKIIDSTATAAARTLAAGMATGNTSPASPWFTLTVADPELSKAAPVKRWLDEVARRLRDVFANSNLYNSLSVFYQDLAVFGTAVMGVEEDDEDVMRATVYPVGSYMLACNERNQVDTFARTFRMTVRQVVRRFGEENVSIQVRQAWADPKRHNDPVEVAHVVMPNERQNRRRLEAKFKPWTSCYFETKCDDGHDTLLSESGFDEFPVIAVRWDAKSEDVYGRGPGWESLPDVKQLQSQAKQMALAVEKQLNPPLVASPELRNRRLSLLPGDVNFADERNGRQKLRPAVEVQPNLEPMLVSVQDVRGRINRSFHVDLFLMLTNDARGTPPTAEEIRGREQEKLLQLGPVLNRLHNEGYDPLIDRAFGIAWRAGLIPDPPEELEGRPLKVEYTSVMAKAQKLAGLGAIERMIAFAAPLTQVDPEAADAVDIPAALDEAGEMLGVPPKVLRSPEERQARRAAREKAMAAQQQAMLAEQVAKTARDLSAADTEGKNALTDATKVLRGPGAA